MTKLWTVEILSTIVVRTEDYEEGEKALEAAQEALADPDSWKKDLSEPRPMEQLPPGWDASCLPWGGPAGEETTIGMILRRNKEDEDRRKAREEGVSKGVDLGEVDTSVEGEKTVEHTS